MKAKKGEQHTNKGPETHTLDYLDKKVILLIPIVVPLTLKVSEDLSLTSISEFGLNFGLK